LSLPNKVVCYHQTILLFTIKQLCSLQTNIFVFTLDILMLLKSTIHTVSQAQLAKLKERSSEELPRELMPLLPDISSHALIISGVRRCGKSTLLHQLMDTRLQGVWFLNFEDPRLYGFEMNDFARIDELINESQSQVLVFDEIQIISGWEAYVRQKLDEGFKILISGSNASLLSMELGTKLTGRHITKELYPFSYSEFRSFNNLENSSSALFEYMKMGGFPEYVKSGNTDVLLQLFEDVLIRDVAVRYGVKDIASLQRLAIYLISNVGQLVTANRIKSMIGVSATSTVMEYFSHLEQSWLFQFVAKFSYSVRKQMVNPRKVYAIDTGLAAVNSKSFTSDYGSLFENLVFLHLRRKSKEIFYFSEQGECDFVVYNHGKKPDIIQVCYELTPDNLQRELNGLYEAMAYFEVQEGYIITLNQSDRFEKNGMVAKVMKCNEYFGA
jgi:uncharacterized protein